MITSILYQVVVICHRSARLAMRTVSGSTRSNGTSTAPINHQPNAPRTFGTHTCPCAHTCMNAHTLARTHAHTHGTDGFGWGEGMGCGRFEDEKQAFEAERRRRQLDLVVQHQTQLGQARFPGGEICHCDHRAKVFSIP